MENQEISARAGVCENIRNITISTYNIEMPWYFGMFCKPMLCLIIGMADVMDVCFGGIQNLCFSSQYNTLNDIEMQDVNSLIEVKILGDNE